MGYSGSTSLVFSCVVVPYGFGYDTALLAEIKRKKRCTALRCCGKLSTLKRATLSILFLSITISADTACKKKKRHGNDLFEQYF